MTNGFIPCLARFFVHNQVLAYNLTDDKLELEIFKDGVFACLNIYTLSRFRYLILYSNLDSISLKSDFPDVYIDYDSIGEHRNISVNCFIEITDSYTVLKDALDSEFVSLMNWFIQNSCFSLLVNKIGFMSSAILLASLESEIQSVLLFKLPIQLINIMNEYIKSTVVTKNLINKEWENLRKVYSGAQAIFLNRDYDYKYINRDLQINELIWNIKLSKSDRIQINKLGSVLKDIYINLDDNLEKLLHIVYSSENQLFFYNI